MLNPEDIAKAAAAQAAAEGAKWSTDPAFSTIKGALDRMAKVTNEAAQKAASIRPDSTLTDLGLESEYAVGKGLITRDELTSFRNTYLAQSQLSLGLIPPILLVVFALLVDTAYLRHYWPVLIFISAITSFLFFLAVERRHKYRIELKLLLLGRLQKQMEADNAAKETKKNQPNKTTTAVSDPVRQAIQEELKNLHLEVKPLVVELHTSSQPKKRDQQIPSGGGVAAKS